MATFLCVLCATWSRQAGLVLLIGSISSRTSQLLFGGPSICGRSSRQWISCGSRSRSALGRMWSTQSSLLSPGIHGALFFTRSALQLGHISIAVADGEWWFLSVCARVSAAPNRFLWSLAMPPQMQRPLWLTVGRFHIPL